jgi:hypothetical protein
VNTHQRFLSGDPTRQTDAGSESPERLDDLSTNLIRLEADIFDQTRVGLQQLREIGAQSISRPPESETLREIREHALETVGTLRSQERRLSAIDR